MGFIFQEHICTFLAPNYKTVSNRMILIAIFIANWIMECIMMFTSIRFFKLCPHAYKIIYQTFTPTMRIHIKTFVMQVK